MSRRLSGGNSPEADEGAAHPRPSLFTAGAAGGCQRPRPLRSRAEPPLAPHRVLAKVLRLYQVQTPQLSLVIRAPCLGQGLLCALCCGLCFWWVFFFSFPCWCFFVFVLFNFFSANVYYYCFCSWRRREKSPAGVSVHIVSVCVHVYVHVQSAAVPSAGSFVEPVSCQSYDSDPLVLIAVAGKGEERSLLPFNGHIFLPTFFFPSLPVFPAMRAAGRRGLTAPRGSGQRGRRCARCPAGAAQPGHRIGYLLALHKDEGAFPRRLKCKVLQPSHAY